MLCLHSIICICLNVLKFFCLERNGSGLEDTLVYLEKLKSDSRNIVRVTEKDGIVSSIYIQLYEQREMFKKFGDVLLLDATHNTNHANMALCTLLVTDSYGKGQPVAYYFASKETIVIHLVCLSLFKEVTINCFIYMISMK